MALIIRGIQYSWHSVPSRCACAKDSTKSLLTGPDPTVGYPANRLAAYTKEGSVDIKLAAAGVGLLTVGLLDARRDITSIVAGF